MDFPLTLALRYLRSKKHAFVSLGTTFAVLGVSLGVSALVTVMSVTGGFRTEFREKVLGVNAHLLVLKHTADFREYRQVMEELRGVPGVTGVAPFVINPMMVTHGSRTATGVLLKGVDPELMPTVLDLPRHVIDGSLAGMRLPDSRPPERRRDLPYDDVLRRRVPSVASASSVPAAAPPPSGPAPSGGAAKPISASPAAASGASAAPLPAGSGRTPFLRMLDQVLAESEAPSAADAGAPGSGDELELPDGAPSGELEPMEGFESDLPDDDDGVAEVMPDPCEDKTRPLPGIVVGATLRDQLAVVIGDCVQVTSPTIGYSYARGAIRAPVAKQFRVIAVFEAGFEQYDARLVYTDLYEAQAFSDAGDSVTGVEMKLADLDQANALGETVEKRLNNGVYNIVDWEELNHGLFTALRIQQIGVSVILALIIVVAAFTVIATLIMVVLEKKKEIAVIKAMGATDAAVLRAFLYQGGMMGVVGTGIGLALGWVLCRVVLVYGFPLDPKVYFISRLPVLIRPAEFIITGAFALLVCLGATAFPAWYAARLRPAEAFREQ